MGGADRQIRSATANVEALFHPVLNVDETNRCFARREIQMDINAGAQTTDHATFRMMKHLRIRGRLGSDLPPGPKSASLIGILPELGRDTLGVLKRTADEYGDVVRLPIGIGPVVLPMVLVRHPDHIDQVLSSANRNFQKSFTSLPARSIFGNGLLTSDGPAWVSQRQALRSLFSSARFEYVVNSTVEAISKEVSRLRALRESGGGEIDITAEMARTSLDILFRSIFGTILSESDAALVGDAFPIVSHEVWQRTVNLLWWMHPSLYSAIPTTSNRNFRNALAALDDLAMRLLESRRKNPADGPEDLLTILLASTEKQSGTFTSRLLRDEIVTFLIAGHETTAMSIAWACYQLSENPRCQQRLSQEANEELSGHTPTLERVGRLAYSRAVVQESLRLYPPAWSIVRDAVADDKLGPYRIPAGTVVITCPYITQRDKRFWPDPDKFIPERFLGDAPRLDSSYFPFGAGMRRCVGERFAMIQAPLMLSLLMQHYSLTPGKSKNIQPYPAVTLRSAQPIHLRLQPVSAVSAV